MRVGFVIPDRKQPWDSVNQGIGYVAAYATKLGLIDQCEVFRTYGTEPSALNAFLQKQWDVVGLTMTQPARDEVKEIARNAQSLGARVVVGGAEVTTCKSETLTAFPDVDFAVVGEGEITFAEILEHLQGRRAPETIKGLVYRADDGSVVANPPREFEENLERFPYPDRKLFTYAYDFHSIIGTRGCPFRCTFCNSSQNWGHHHRVRSPDAIQEEIEYVVGLYGPEKIFTFNDDAFNIKKDWVVEVAGRIKSLGIRWWIRGVKAELITDEVAEALKNSRCVGLAVGVESANNECLKAMRKGATIEKILDGVRRLTSRGISTTGQFIIGNQADTIATVQESIDCARHFTEVTFGVAYPIPHTALHDFVMENKLLLDKPVPVKYEGNTIDWILFDTPHFRVEQRLQAIEMAIQAKVYHNIDYRKAA